MKNVNESTLLEEFSINELDERTEFSSLALCDAIRGTGEDCGDDEEQPEFCPAP